MPTRRFFVLIPPSSGAA